MISITVLTVYSCVGAVLLYCVGAFVQFYRDVRKRGRLINKLPGQDPHPIWGNLKDFLGPGEAGLQQMHEETSSEPSGIAKVWLGPVLPTATVFKPETIRPVLKTSEPKPFNFGGYPMIKPWLGDGLLLAKGQKWARNRRLLTPAFHFDILKPYVEINNQCSRVLVNKLEQFGASGEFFEVFTHISLLTLDIMLRCAFSYENDCQERGQSHPYVKAVTSMGDAVTYRFIRPWLHLDWVFYNLTSKGRQFIKDCAFVHSVSEEIISKRRAALVEQGESAFRSSRYIDFLDILLTATDTDGQKLTDQEIRDEVDTFLFEGHDTTASGISWTLYSLAQNPDCQTKCQQEIDELLDGRSNDEITWDDLANLPYLTMCIKEGLRLHTPVPYVERQLTKDMEIEGHFVPAKTIVDLNIYVLHHYPSVWHDPYEFIPERFSPENLDKMDPFAFVPFSAGPRNCIGQNFAMHEMKVTIAQILRRFSLSVDPSREAKHEIKVVMKTEDGMFMKVTPRSRVTETKM